MSINVADELKLNEGLCQERAARVRELIERMVKLELELQKKVAEVYLQLGNLAKEVIEVSVGSRYGIGVVDKLAEKLDICPRTLYDCIRVAHAIPAAVFRKHVRPPMRWSHVLLIVRWQQAAKLDQLAARIIEENMTVEDLRCILMSEPKAPRIAAAATRRAAIPIPRNAKIAVQRLATSSSRFLQSLKQSLFCEEFDTADSISSMLPDDVTEERRDDVQRATEMLNEIADRAKAHAEELSGGLARMNGVLRKRQQEEQKKQQALARAEADKQSAMHHPFTLPTIPGVVT